MRKLFISVIFVLHVLVVSYGQGQYDANWLSHHIGVNLGIAKHSGDTIFIEGSGYIQGSQSKDRFYYYYKNLGLYGEIIAKIKCTKSLHRYSKLGLMIRQDVTENSSFYMLGTGLESGIASVSRDSAGLKNVAFWENWDAGYLWVKLVRRRNQIFSFISSNGIDWELFEERKIHLSGKVLAGLAVAAHKSIRDKSTSGYFLNTSVVTSTLPNDTIAPSRPGEIATVCSSQRDVTLEWLPAIDNDIIPPVYDVFCNGKLYLSNFRNTQCSISDLQKDSMYTVSIVAEDYTGNTSESVTYSIKPSKPGVEKPSISIDNPYTDFYGKHSHWSDTVKWKNIIRIDKISGIMDKNNVMDSAVLHRVISQVSKDGGGVLYFPQGTYYFNFSLKLESGVVLRGADLGCIKNAVDQNYRPLSVFQFPEYKPYLNGAGMSNATAFKMIYGDTSGVTNCGLVNLDINRAHIGFYSSGYYRPDTKGEPVLYRQLTNRHRNILIFGVRQNNSALPHPLIPSKIQMDENNGWQRWVWPYSGVIHVMAYENCTVANCRINDAITDSYDQPSYITDYGYRFYGKETSFDYSRQNGISINSIKVNWESQGSHTGNWNSLGVAKNSNNPSLENDPGLFGTNVEILDNYVAVAQGYKAWSAGFGETIVEGNVKEVLPNYNNVIDENGQFSTLSYWNPDMYFEKDYYKNESGEILPYRLLVPENLDSERKIPLILYIHGKGEKGNDNEGQMKHFVKFFVNSDNSAKNPCFVVAPQCPENSDWSGWPGEEQWPLTSAVDIIKLMIKKYPVDKRRIYLMGVSEGGVVCWEALLRYPKLFAGAIPMGAIWNIQEDESKILKEKAIWTFNGAKDQYIPVEFVRYSILKLQKAGFSNLRYTIYPHQSHWAWIDAAREPELLSWLFSHHNGRIFKKNTQVSKP